MSGAKKYQVFVSSTYEDLKSERQAAVMAILESGNIPAGMELFTAGSESQLAVIKEWIDDSDIYVLILGDRYGSIEPKSNKSYIQVEYEYALEKDKPLFAIVKRATKNDNQDYIDFRKLVESKMVIHWDDEKDIRLAIYKSVEQLVKKRSQMSGWVKGGSELKDVAQELATLSKKNRELEERLKDLQKPEFSGLTFDELLEALKRQDFGLDRMQRALKDKPVLINEVNKINVKLGGDFTYSLLHYFVAVGPLLSGGTRGSYLDDELNLKLTQYGLVDFIRDRTFPYFKMTESGIKFLNLANKKFDL